MNLEVANHRINENPDAGKGLYSDMFWGLILVVNC